MRISRRVLPDLFQSTLPTRGSDPGHRTASLWSGYFNPRSPRGGATRRTRVFYAVSIISIHAPHEGERQVRHGSKRRAGGFQSTLPTRGSDADCQCDPLHLSISIHAPHEGERRDSAATYSPESCISIHAPHEGERQRPRIPCGKNAHFNPRSPRGGATIGRGFRHIYVGQFQSTLPTRGSDPPPIMAKSTIRAFQSTLPTRGSDTG